LRFGVLAGPCADADVWGVEDQDQRVNVILGSDCLLWLDKQAVAARQRTGVSLKRSALLRGIVRGLKEASLDLSHCRNEEDVRKMVGFLLAALSPGRSMPTQRGRFGKG